jgi:hypothetical protein
MDFAFILRTVLQLVGHLIESGNHQTALSVVRAVAETAVTVTAPTAPASAPTPVEAPPTPQA